MNKPGRSRAFKSSAGVLAAAVALAGCGGVAGNRSYRPANGNLPFPIASTTPEPAEPNQSSPAPSTPAAAPSSPAPSTPATPQGQTAESALPAVTAKAGAPAYCQPLALAVTTLRKGSTPAQGVSVEVLAEYSALLEQAAAQAPEALKPGLTQLARSSQTPPNPQTLGAVDQAAQNDCGFTIGQR